MRPVLGCSSFSYHQREPMAYSKSPEITTDFLDRSFPRSFRPHSSIYHHDPLVSLVYRSLCLVTRFSLPNSQLPKYGAPRIRSTSPSWDEWSRWGPVLSGLGFPFRSWDQGWLPLSVRTPCGGGALAFLKTLAFGGTTLTSPQWLLVQ